MNVFACTLLASTLLMSYFGASRSAIDDEYGYADKIDFISIEPIKHSLYTSRITVKYSFSKKPKSISSLSIRIINSQYVRGKQIYLGSSNVQTYTVIYDYPQTYSNLSREDTFKFELMGDYSDTVEIASKIYSPTTMYINNVNETYESPENIAIYRRGEEVAYYSEKFVFTNLNKEFVLGKYWGIDLSGIYFNYVAPKYFPLTYENARLIIEGRQGAFEKLGSEMATPNWRKLSLSLSKDEKTGKYLFHPETQLYVNPITLDMSTYPIDNYIETKYLFFPRPIEDIETYVIRFMVDNLGANNNQFSYQFSVSISTNLYGNCNDSSYCLSTEEAVPDLELGTIITH